MNYEVFYDDSILLPTLVFSQNNLTDCEELDLLTYNDTSVCGQSITLTAIAGLDNYSWSTGSDNQFTQYHLNIHCSNITQVALL